MKNSKRNPETESANVETTEATEAELDAIAAEAEAKEPKMDMYLEVTAEQLAAFAGVQPEDIEPKDLNLVNAWLAANGEPQNQMAVAKLWETMAPKRSRKILDARRAENRIPNLEKTFTEKGRRLENTLLRCRVAYIDSNGETFRFERRRECIPYIEWDVSLSAMDGNGKDAKEEFTHVAIATFIEDEKTTGGEISLTAD